MKSRDSIWFHMIIRLFIRVWNDVSFPIHCVHVEGCKFSNTLCSIFSERHVLVATNGQVRGELVSADNRDRRVHPDRLDLRGREVLPRHPAHDRPPVQALGHLLERDVARHHAGCFSREYGF